MTLWAQRHRATAAAAWHSWYRKALRSGIEPLRRFARALKPYLPGILAHCQYPLGTNLIEGINNKIKVIKRMAYGFRDDAYFFLKIRAAFPLTALLIRPKSLGGLKLCRSRSASTRLVRLPWPSVLPLSFHCKGYLRAWVQAPDASARCM